MTIQPTSSDSSFYSSSSGSSRSTGSPFRSLCHTFTLHFYFFLLIIFNTCHPITSYPTLDPGPKVWLTVSSVVEKVRLNGARFVIQRKIELNWRNIPISISNNIQEAHHPFSNDLSNNPVWVALFDRDKDQPNSDHALVSLQPKILTKGRFRSDIEFPTYNFTPQNLTSDCLGFWIMMFDSQRIYHKNCIRAQPFWMMDNYESIKEKSIKDLMIPGTHNAGSYERGFKSEPRAIIKKYVICQDESIFNQLAYGIRYMDLRISFENVIGKVDKLWIVHGILRTEVSLDSLLEQVASFLDATTHEVMILDFHRFEKGFEDHPQDEKTYNMNKQRHDDVRSLIESRLGNHISRDWNMGFNVRMDDLVASKKRLIIGYTANRYIREAMFYPRVRHLWAQADNITKLEDYLNRMVCSISGQEGTSAMAQLTPTTWGVIFDQYGGLRKLAQDVNWVITDWFEDRWWPCVNIVSTDFFLGNNIIEISILANRARPLIPTRTRFKRNINMIEDDESPISESRSLFD